MRSIETIANVSPDGKLTVQLPSDVPPGNHRVVVVIYDTPMIDGTYLESSMSANAATEGDTWEVLNALLGMVETLEE